MFTEEEIAFINQHVFVRMGVRVCVCVFATGVCQICSDAHVGGNASA